jgi:hypothetical protein
MAFTVVSASSSSSDLGVTQIYAVVTEGIMTDGGVGFPGQPPDGLTGEVVTDGDGVATDEDGVMTDGVVTDGEWETWRRCGGMNFA